MEPDENILEGARSIRPELPELLGADAGIVDDALAALLAQARAGQKVDTEILRLLAGREPTREWISEYLEDRRQSFSVGDEGLQVRSFRPLPGAHAPLPTRETYRCPEGDYVWHRRTVGMEPPQCPTHHIPLVRGDAA